MAWFLLFSLVAQFWRAARCLQSRRGLGGRETFVRGDQVEELVAGVLGGVERRTEGGQMT